MVSQEEYDERREALDLAKAQLTQALETVYQARAALGLPAQPLGRGKGRARVPKPTISPGPAFSAPAFYRRQWLNGIVSEGRVASVDRVVAGNADFVHRRAGRCGPNLAHRGSSPPSMVGISSETVG